MRRGSREAGGEGGRRRRGRKNGRKWGVKKTQVEFTLYLRLNNLLSTKRLSKQITRLLLAPEKTHLLCKGKTWPTAWP